MVKKTKIMPKDLKARGFKSCEQYISSIYAQLALLSLNPLGLLLWSLNILTSLNDLGYNNGTLAIVLSIKGLQG